MFTKKSAKFIFITLLSTISLTGYFHVYPSSIFASKDSKTEKNTKAQEEKQQSTTNINTEYEKLLEEYKKFAEYIYKIDDNGQPIKDNEKAITSGEKPALGLLTQFLNEQSKNSPTLIEDQDQILRNYHEQFTKFINQVNKFQGEINNLSDETNNKQEILNKFKDSENKDLWLTSSDSEKFKGYFSDAKLAQQEICDIQLNLGIKVDQKPGDELDKSLPACGKFGNDTYNKLEEKLISTTKEFKKKLDEINPLIDTITVSDTNSDKNTNNNTNNANNNNTDPNPSSIDKNLIISSLALLIGIISSLLSLITLLKLLNYQKESKQDLEKLKKLSDQKNNKINQLTEEIERLKRQKNNPPPVQTFRPDYDDINPGYNTHPQRTSQPNLFKSTDLRTKPNSEPEIPPSIPTNIVSDQKDDSNNLITSYQTNPQSFLQQGTKVRMTTETTNKVLDGTWNDVVNLEKYRTGEYSVITNDYLNYYVVLDPHTKFNQQTLQIINKSKLFICHGNLSNTVKGEDIQINKPAKVRQDGEYWTLIESGELTL